MLYLTETDVTELITVAEIVDILEAGFRLAAAGGAVNLPRRRVHWPGGAFHMLVAGAPAQGVVGFKCYTGSRQGARFQVMLYSSENGAPLAMIEANLLGQMRTGAASGLATRYMARQSAQTLALIGSGFQARSQLEAICAVRQLRRVWVYSRTAEHREDFAREMSAKVGVEIIAVDSAEKAVRQADIVATITSSTQPVVEGRWLVPGVHINAAGSNSLLRRELDEETVTRAHRIVADSVEQCQLEAGDLLPAVQKGLIHWSTVRELHEVVAGYYPGRDGDGEITLFKSLGIGLEDVVTAAKVYERAKHQGKGQIFGV
ncbi:MAG: ornithine cyclodeaminase family protein [Chloroflexi bacterium]|nr:ornithine cyclodeaminase family protein [Chloroflexota bacterium]